MKDTLIETVLVLWRKNEWKHVIQLRYNSETKNGKNDWSKLLWVWPEEKNLIFIGDYVKRFNLNSIVSIGCGSGLFEWLLEQSTGIPVEGIEIDNGWWNSRYASPTFIPLSFVEDNSETVINSNKALLFCYFNNEKAFQKYIKNYTGNLVYIIGPGKGRGTHTNPAPFSADFGDKNWDLIDYQEVMNTKDYIGVYFRKINQFCVKQN